MKINLNLSNSCQDNRRPEKVQRNTLHPNLVATYKDLFGNHVIDVRWSSRGLVARVRDIKTGRELENLPLIGVPGQFVKERNLRKIKAFFLHTHLIPERGVNGIYNRVCANVTAYGGQGEVKIPFQPDLALGSVVDGETLEKMERYAEIRAEKQSLEDQIRFAEEKIEALQIKKVTRGAQKAPLDSEKEKTLLGKTTDTLIKIWDAEIENLTTFIVMQVAKLASLQEELPTFSSFKTKATSPLNREASRFEVRPDGFESIHYTEQYVRMSESNAEILNKVKQSSSTITASADVGYLMWKAGAKLARTAALANTLLKIKKEKTAEGVLLIDATATLKHVHRITELKYDTIKLKRILEVMKGNNPDELKAYGISSALSKEKALYIITEEIRGAVFTAIVTFQDESKMNRDAAIEQKEATTQLATHLEGGEIQFKGALEASLSFNSASKNEQDILRSKGLTRININIQTQGALPQFERNVLEREVMSHLHMDPFKVEFSKQNEADMEKMATSSGTDKQIATEKERLKMEYAGVIALNSLKGLKSATEVQKIHSLESVMAAYENFVEQITKDPNCGIPIGFNYEILKQSDIESIIKKAEST